MIFDKIAKLKSKLNVLKNVRSELVAIIIMGFDFEEEISDSIVQELQELNTFLEGEQNEPQ